MTLDRDRRQYAEKLNAQCRFRTPGLIDAFATVRREDFLPPGPWTVISASDYKPGVPVAPRRTPDADPRHLYQDVAVAIDPARQLFNGQPSALATWIDALELAPGARALHVGAGPGYYTAIMAHVVGPSGRVVAIEVDQELASRARANLAGMPWVDVRCSDATERHADRFDAIFINAGVTHPREEWLDALRGRMVIPLTATFPQMTTIGKGFMMLLERQRDDTIAARSMSIVMIFSAVGLRDDALNATLGDAFRKTPMPPETVLRRDRHERSASCWFHADDFCFSVAATPADPRTS